MLRQPGAQDRCTMIRTTARRRRPAGPGPFTEFDAAYAFVLVFGQSFVGGFDTAINSDPNKNILVGFHV
jgi:hypothetical protein